MKIPNFVYRLYDQSNNLLYVGLTGNVGMRMAQHRDSKQWWSAVDRIEVEQFPDRPTAAKAETEQIRSLQPIHNIRSTLSLSGRNKVVHADSDARKRGRPPVKEPRNRPFIMRVTSSEHALVSQVAKDAGLSISEYCRREMLEYAREILKLK